MFGLSSAWCEIVSEKYTKFGTNDLIPIVLKGNYSQDYSTAINNNVSYLFLYDYLMVNVLII